MPPAAITDPDVLAACIQDVGHSGDESFAEAASTEIQRLPAFSAGVVSLEAPDQGLAFFSKQIAIHGPAEAGYEVRFSPAGSALRTNAGNPYSEISLAQSGDQVVTLWSPVAPGDYELRYLKHPGGERVLVGQPFRSVVPIACIEAPDTVRSFRRAVRCTSHRRGESERESRCRPSG